MSTAIEETETTPAATAQAERNRCDEEEMARRIEKRMNDAKAAISEKLEDSKVAAERLVKRGRYALEDGLSELAHSVRRHPMSFLGIAFAAGAAAGLIIAQTSKRRETTEE